MVISWDLTKFTEFTDQKPGLSRGFSDMLTVGSKDVVQRIPLANMDLAVSMYVYVYI